MLSYSRKKPNSQSFTVVIQPLSTFTIKRNKIEHNSINKLADRNPPIMACLFPQAVGSDVIYHDAIKTKVHFCEPNSE